MAAVSAMVRTSSEPWVGRGTAGTETPSNGKDLGWADSSKQWNFENPAVDPDFFPKGAFSTGTSGKLEVDDSDVAVVGTMTTPVELTRAEAALPSRTEKPKTGQGERILRTHYANQVLADLRELGNRCGEAIAARYAAPLLKTMRAARDGTPLDPFIDVVVALHDALAFENSWIHYSAEQYHGAYEIIRKLSKHSNVTDEKAEKSIMALENLGFDTTPFTTEFETAG